jgi:hypothetical protein
VEKEEFNVGRVLATYKGTLRVGSFMKLVVISRTFISSGAHQLLKWISISLYAGGLQPLYKNLKVGESGLSVNFNAPKVQS